MTHYDEVEKLHGRQVRPRSMRVTYATDDFIPKPLGEIGSWLRRVPKGRSYLLVPIPAGEFVEVIYHDRVLKSVTPLSLGVENRSKPNNLHAVKRRLFPMLREILTDKVFVEYFYGWIVGDEFIALACFRESRSITNDILESIAFVDRRSSQIEYASRHYKTVCELDPTCQYGATNTMSPTLYRVVNGEDIPMNKSKYVWWNSWNNKATLYFGSSGGVRASDLARDAKSIVDVCRRHSAFDVTGYMLLTNEFDPADGRPLVFTEEIHDVKGSSSRGSKPQPKHEARKSGRAISRLQRAISRS